MDDLLDQKLPTRRAAERIAKLLGGTGAHQVAGGWLPLNSSEELRTLINEGVVAYRRIRRTV